MSKPDFQSMSPQELHRYVLSHREDQEAFYAYVDMLHEKGRWIEMPAVDSVQDLEKFPEFTARFRTGSEPPGQAM
jgi:hypothetical protein